MNPCEQADNIKHIQEDLHNHREWRTATTEVLSDIKIICATMEERLKSKLDSWDKHVEEGKLWRRTVVLLCWGYVIQFMFIVFSSGILYEKIHRLEGLHPYGSSIEKVDLK